MLDKQPIAGRRSWSALAGTPQELFRSRLVRKVRDNPIARNAGALYIVRICDYFIPLITLPFLARVLQPEGIGMLAFAQSTAAWLAIVLEYSFGITATREVARYRSDPAETAGIAARVMGAKTALAAALLVSLFSLFLFFPLLRQHQEYLIWALILSLCQGFAPLWYFVGTESLQRTLYAYWPAKLLFVAGIFLVAADPQDAWKVLALQAGGQLIYTGVLFRLLYREVPWVFPSLGTAARELWKNSGVFIGRSATTLYNSLNIVVLGIIASADQVGLYSGADRFISFGIGLTGPLFLALYPRSASLMAKDPAKARRFAKQVFWMMTLLSLGIALVLFFFSPLLVRTFLGERFIPAVGILQALAVLVPLNAVIGVLNGQYILPLGLDRAYSLASLAAGVFNICFTVALYPRYGLLGVVGVLVTTHLLIVGALGYFLSKELRRSQPPPETTSRRMNQEAA